MTKSFLTTDLLEEWHTASDYLGWARSLVERVKSEPGGLERILLRTGLGKPLMEEAIPIGLLASKYFDGSSDVRIALKLGSQNFDATVSDGRGEGGSVSHIEVTLAHEGEDQYLRNLHLLEKGYVSDFGPVTKHGTKKTELSVQVEGKMKSQAEVIQCERCLVSDAIERKLGKHYPPGTLLLVGFDDRMAFDRKDNIANLESVVAEYLPRLKAFHTLAIVGLHQGILLSWRTSDAT